MAIPFDSNGYLPTYYGNTISWEQATTITLGTANNPYNINLVPAGQMTPGPGSTSGQINMGDVSSSMVDKINMILLNDQNQPIGFASVSTSGTFGFPTMAYGTYYLHAEMPGITSDYVMITLSAEKPHADVVMTFSGNSILGIGNKVSMVDSYSVYPNPVTDHLTINIDMKQDVVADMELYNMTGQLVVKSQAILNQGNNTVRIQTTALQSGIYSLRIYSNEGMIINTKIVKTR
jgi:hypothetical protein